MDNPKIPESFHFTHARRVEFCDTDMAGIVHFASLLKFVESAEHAFFRSLGHSVHPKGGADQEGWARYETTCRYRQPAFFEQVVEIGLRLEDLRSSSLRYRFWICAEGRAPDALIATGEFTIVHVQLDLKTRRMAKAPIPADLRQRFAAILGPAG